MSKRIRKNTAKPTLTQEWFRRYQQGESPPAIAKKDGYDVRTVRKYIEQYRQEVETKEAKTTVLRNALERHYDDLRAYAEWLNSQYFGADKVEPLKDAEFIEDSLRQHIPRSQVWTYLSKLSKLDVEKIEQQQKVYLWIEKEVRAYSGLVPLIKKGYSDLANNIIEALKFQADEWAEGTNGMSLNEHLRSDNLGEGQRNLHFGAFHIIAHIDQQHAEEYAKLVRDALGYLEFNLKKAEELLTLENIIKEIARVKRKLKEELAVIRLRRIVPGRCKYCPL